MVLVKKKLVDVFYVLSANILLEAMFSYSVYKHTIDVDTLL